MCLSGRSFDTETVFGGEGMHIHVFQSFYKGGTTLETSFLLHWPYKWDFLFASLSLWDSHMEVGLCPMGNKFFALGLILTNNKGKT